MSYYNFKTRRGIGPTFPLHESAKPKMPSNKKNNKLSRYNTVFFLTPWFSSVGLFLQKKKLDVRLVLTSPLSNMDWSKIPT